jgi:PEP-CTERM motif
MLHSKSSTAAILAAVFLLGIGANGSAHAQCGYYSCATEWNGIGGSIINLGGLPGSTWSSASGVDSLGGRVVGTSYWTPPPSIPEPSTWAMLLLGFAGLGFVGSRLRRVSARKGRLGRLRQPHYEPRGDADLTGVNSAYKDKCI